MLEQLDRQLHQLDVIRVAEHEVGRRLAAPQFRFLEADQIGLRRGDLARNPISPRGEIRELHFAPDLRDGADDRRLIS